MKQEIAEIWATALGSGEFKKTRGKLRKGEKSRCCLGVLCDLYARANPDVEGWERGEFYTETWFFHDAENELPYAVQEWAGMKTDYGSFQTDGVPFNLMKINDETNTSFKEIGEIIRKNWEAL